MVARDGIEPAAPAFSETPTESQGFCYYLSSQQPEFVVPKKHQLRRLRQSLQERHPGPLEVLLLVPE